VIAEDMKQWEEEIILSLDDVCFNCGCRWFSRGVRDRGTLFAETICDTCHTDEAFRATYGARGCNTLHPGPKFTSPHRVLHDSTLPELTKIEAALVSIDLPLPPSSSLVLCSASLHVHLWELTKNRGPSTIVFIYIIIYYIYIYIYIL
jgi:hypothetical protein